MKNCCYSRLKKIQTLKINWNHNLIIPNLQETFQHSNKFQVTSLGHRLLLLFIIIFTCICRKFYIHNKNRHNLWVNIFISLYIFNICINWLLGIPAAFDIIKRLFRRRILKFIHRIYRTLVFIIFHLLQVNVSKVFWPTKLWDCQSGIKLWLRLHLFFCSSHYLSLFIFSRLRTGLELWKCK